MTASTGDDARDFDLLRRAAGGDRAGWDELLTLHRQRLLRMVELRMDQRLHGRLDASDVVQEAYLEAWQRLDEYIGRPDLPVFLWLRFLTGQRLITLHRHHFGMKMRAVTREVAVPETTSGSLAARLVARDPRPSEVAAAAELQRRCHALLESMDPLDREILALRHFEQLGNAEAARVLGLQESAASKRYLRALQRLRAVLGDRSEPTP